jgi:hypothetical protein
LLHVPPILAFVLGVALAETLARPAGRRIVRRPARFVLVPEIVVLVIVGAPPRRCQISFIGPRGVWVAAAMLVLALAAIVIETVTLFSIETTDDHSKQDDSPGRTISPTCTTRT